MTGEGRTLRLRWVIDAEAEAPCYSLNAVRYATFSIQKSAKKRKGQRTGQYTRTATGKWSRVEVEGVKLNKRRILKTLWHANVHVTNGP